MTTRKNDYPPEITDLSKKELEEIAGWLEQKNRAACLIGGWAVYYYTNTTPGFFPLGSKDIDLVFYTKEEENSFEHYFCKAHGYQKTRGYAPDWYWAKKVPRKNTEIILDLVTASKATDWKIRGTTMSWAFLKDDAQKIRTDKGMVIDVPAKEMLLLYKSAGIVDRTERKKLPDQDQDYLESKIWKDAFDILALNETGISEEKLETYAERTKLKPLIEAAKEIIRQNIGNYELESFSKAEKFLSNEKA